LGGSFEVTISIWSADAKNERMHLRGSEEDEIGDIRRQIFNKVASER